jgi:hypothetical protein
MKLSDRVLKELAKMVVGDATPFSLSQQQLHNALLRSQAAHPSFTTAARCVPDGPMIASPN